MLRDKVLNKGERAGGKKIMLGEIILLIITSSDPKKKSHFSLKINNVIIRTLNQTKLSD